MFTGNETGELTSHGAVNGSPQLRCLFQSLVDLLLTVADTIATEEQTVSSQLPSGLSTSEDRRGCVSSRRSDGLQSAPAGIAEAVPTW